MKKCTKCKKTKPLDAFHKYSANKDGRHSNCKECRALSVRDWKDKNPDKVKVQNIKGNLKANYGIGIELYEYLLEQQGGKCKICGEFCKSGKRLAVDHRHSDGKIRGLLCVKCNTALGLANDNVELLKKMIIYLEEV